MKVLIQFLASCTCNEHHVFIIRKTICTCSFVWYVFVHLCQQSSMWKLVSNTSFHLLDCLYECKKNIRYKIACTNGLPHDEHMMSET